MLTHPDFDEVWYGPRGMKAGIAACINQKCVVSAVTLIYSSIDAIAAMTRQLSEPKGEKGHFMRWVDDYLTSELRLPLSGVDIYAARCGIVHAYGQDSDLSRQGKAMKLIYRWRTGHRPDDPILAELAKEAVVVEIESLFSALQRAVDRFQDRILNDEDLRLRVETHIKGLLCYKPWQPVTVTVAA